MPYIGKEFTHAIESEKIGQHYYVNMGEDEESYMPYYQHKEATDCFYTDFKELLAQCKELNPTFNDDEKSFTILGLLISWNLLVNYDKLLISSGWNVTNDCTLPDKGSLKAVIFPVVWFLPIPDPVPPPTECILLNKTSQV